MERHFFYVQEVAKMLSVSDDTVIREIKDGKMGAIKIRREYRIGESDYDAYIKAVKTSA